jgi:hypothetical protein
MNIIARDAYQSVITFINNIVPKISQHQEIITKVALASLALLAASFLFILCYRGCLAIQKNKALSKLDAIDRPTKQNPVDLKPLVEAENVKPDDVKKSDVKENEGKKEATEKDNEVKDNVEQGDVKESDVKEKEGEEDATEKDNEVKDKPIAGKAIDQLPNDKPRKISTRIRNLQSQFEPSTT